MENDLNTALAISLIQNKPTDMDIVKYVTQIQSKIMEKENELFFQEFLCDSETNYLCDQQYIEENTSQSCVDLQQFDEIYNNNMPIEKNNKIECEIFSPNSYTPNFVQKPSTCLIQPIITIKTLNENDKIQRDSGYSSYNYCKVDIQDINKKPIEIMSQSIQNALDHLKYILFDNSKLLETVINWKDSSNLVRYFVDLITNVAESNEFVFTCRDYVTMFVQNTAFKILDSHYLFHSIHVEYQCNLLEKFCFDKYVRWAMIHLFLNRLKIDIQVIPCYNSLRSIFYTFHFIDKLLQNVDFNVISGITNNKNSITDLWKTNHTNKNGNETDVEQMLNEWKSLLEYISMEALRKNSFLVSIRANQCLESLKLITFK